ncbi:MAG: hypothetical protein V3V03_06095 [Hyphomonadaceae bacterium]
MNSTRRLEMFAFDRIRTALVGLIGLTGAHLGVVILTRVIFKRARQQLAGIEALLRRLFLQMALEIEHSLTPDTSEVTGFWCAPSAHKSKRSWSLFQSPGSGQLPDFSALPQQGPRWNLPLTAPIIARITFLQNLMEDPDRHARRMAFQLARQRADQYACLPHTDVNLRRLGTELSLLYPLLGASLIESIRGRPPRVGQRPRPPPRIRQL